MNLSLDEIWSIVLDPSKFSNVQKLRKIMGECFGVSICQANHKVLMSKIQADLLSVTARCILEGPSLSLNMARNYCKLSVGLQRKQPMDDRFGRTQMRILQQVATHRGLILCVSKFIPCNCLDDMKKKTKKEMKDGACFQCEKVLPRSELYQCSKCKTVSYCSKDCQLKGWERGRRKSCERLAAEYEREIEQEEAKKAADTL